jgi:PTS system nitrogen regulatory IIA component
MSVIIEDSLAKLVKRGGIYHKVPGSNRQEIMSNVIDKLPSLSPNKKIALLQAVMEREALMSTGVENGIAMPHPRTPMLEDGEDPFVAIAFPLSSPDWNTPDNSKVNTIFLIVSESPKQHLGVLSKINFLCQQEKFFSHLCERSPKEKIIAAIEEAEKDWSEG